MLYAIDKRTGKIRVGARRATRASRATSGTSSRPTPAPRRPPTAASSSRGSDRRASTPTTSTADLRWKVDLGRVDMGAYDIPTYEWGPASSPIIWNGLVIVQCDTQADSFLLALECRDRRDGVEDAIATSCRRGARRPSSTTPPGRSSSPTRRTSCAATIRRPARSCGGSAAARRSPRRRRSSPTACIIVASGRAPERPIFVGAARRARRPHAAPSGQTEQRGVAWSKTGRGSYMPTPLAYRGHRLRARQQRRASTPTTCAPARRSIASACRLSAAASARRRSRPTARSICRTRTARCSSSRPGATFKHLATNSMGELLMATPALSDGVMFVRSSTSVSAIGGK